MRVARLERDYVYDLFINKHVWLKEGHGGESVHTRGDEFLFRHYLYDNGAISLRRRDSHQGPRANDGSLDMRWTVNHEVLRRRKKKASSQLIMFDKYWD